MWLARRAQQRVQSTSWSVRACCSSLLPRAVDTERYPLHDPFRIEELLNKSREDVVRDGYCHFPGFLRTEAVATLIKEATALDSAGLHFRSFEAHNVFLEDTVTSKDLPVGALRAKEFGSSKVLICQDDIALDSMILEVFKWEPLRAFLQHAFGLEALYPSADPLGGAYYNIFDASHRDSLGWHFDRSHFSMNLILQTTPGAGGDFQYVPDSREAIEQMERWEEVERHIEGKILTPELSPGSLYLFAGNRSLHQVTPVTSGKRVNVIFTYTEEEGSRLNEYTLRKFFGRSNVRSAAAAA